MTLSPLEPARSAGWKMAVKWVVRAISQVACGVCTRPGDYGAVRIAARRKWVGGVAWPVVIRGRPRG